MRPFGEMVQEFLRNQVLFCAFFSWISAQIVKFLIDGIRNRRWNVRSLLSISGGMPSSHTSSIVALSFGIGFRHGFDTPAFAVSGVIALIVMSDAVGVRRETGKQGKLLNFLTSFLNAPGTDPAVGESNMKERMGHTPAEVMGGFLWGMIWAFIWFAFIAKPA